MSQIIEDLEASAEYCETFGDDPMSAKAIRAGIDEIKRLMAENERLRHQDSQRFNTIDEHMKHIRSLENQIAELQRDRRVS